MSLDTVSFPLVQYGYCVLGILVSVILPILRRLVPQPKTLSPEPPIWRRYAAIGLFSLITAVVVVAFGRSSVSSWYWYDAFLSGYAWDSTLQKVIRG